MLSCDAPGGLIISICRTFSFDCAKVKFFFESAKFISGLPKVDDSPSQKESPYNRH